MKLIVLFFLTIESIFAQHYLNGVVFDDKTKQPIPFVSIGIVGKNVGTLSDEYGVFNIKLFENQKKDSIKLSTIGYKAQVFLVSDFVKDLNKTIYLESLPTKLAEVIVKGWVVIASQLLKTTPYELELLPAGFRAKPSINIMPVPLFIETEAGLVFTAAPTPSPTPQVGIFSAVGDAFAAYPLMEILPFPEFKFTDPLTQMPAV
jgi:hypothetical protein